MRKMIWVVLLVIGLARVGFGAARPNVVIILADDMGFSDIGCYGGEIDTPNIDRLAKEGLRFSQFYNAARCCPTRACLLTGLYPHQAGMGWMAGRPTALPGYAAELSHNAVTIAEVMRSAGYETYMTGKWHVTSREGPRANKENWPMQRGFEHYYGTIKGGGSYFDPATLTRGNVPITPDDDEAYKPESFYYTDAIGDNAVKFIGDYASGETSAAGKRDEKNGHDEKNGDVASLKLATSPFSSKPLFMYVAFTSPHWPLHAPADTIAKYRGKYDGGYEPVRAARFAKQKEMGLIDANWDLSPQAGEWDRVEHKDWEARCMEVYAAQVYRMDQNVGKIVKALNDAKMMDNTLIFFLSDNGGCAEPMGREVHEDRAKATTRAAMKPDQLQEDVFPKFTRSGEPVRDGDIVMPGPATSFIAYGRSWANVSNTPFKEYKHWVHEGGISTPLIVHWPSVLHRDGQIEKQPGHLIDLMATCVDVGGATYPKTFDGHEIKPMQGVSLVPAFTGKALSRERPIFWEHEGNRAVRDGKWKLVAKGAAGAWELYDMGADRTEMHDLASAEPDRVKQMAAAWEDWAKASDVLPLQEFEKPKKK